MILNRSLKLAAFVAPLVGGMAVGFAYPAHAQLQQFNGAPTGPAVQSDSRTEKKPREAPPPGLPGAKSNNAEVARPEKLPSDMAPTEALFDAINRGDILTARDAINRGADLNGHNILGMSPTELSVDLGRNDITFLLLSLRGSSGSGGDGTSANAAAAPALKGTRGKQGATVATSSSPSPRLTRQQQAAARQASAEPIPGEFGDDIPAAPAPRTPAVSRRQASAAPIQAGGGTPIPQMGFLGFGGATR